MILVTDRTESDALLGNEKGIYSYNDLNRVESAVAEIRGYFGRLGMCLPLHTKTDWGLPGQITPDSAPMESQMRRYLQNVAEIKNRFPCPVQLPKSMDYLTWIGANHIEMVLESAFLGIDNILKSYQYSGEINAGEEFNL